jgi:hypothetical protein
MKTFDYFGCDIPILGATVQDSVLYSILSEFKYGYFADKNDVADIANSLDSIYRNSPECLDPSGVTTQYQFKELTEELDSILESAVRNC